MDNEEDAAVSKNTRLEIVKEIQAEAAKAVTSRELSGELKAAGAVQRGTLDSDVWVDDAERGVVVLAAHIGIVCENSGTGKILCRAFRADELMASLPSVIEGKGVLHTIKANDTDSGWDTYAVGYMDYRGVLTPFQVITDNNLAEALGKLSLWGLKNGYIENPKGGL